MFRNGVILFVIWSSWVKFNTCSPPGQKWGRVVESAAILPFSAQDEVLRTSILSRSWMNFMHRKPNMELDQSLFQDLESALADCGLSDQGLQFCLPAGLMLVQLGFITWHWSNFHFWKWYSKTILDQCGRELWLITRFILSQVRLYYSYVRQYEHCCMIYGDFEVSYLC